MADKINEFGRNNVPVSVFLSSLKIKKKNNLNCWKCVVLLSALIALAGAIKKQVIIKTSEMIQILAETQGNLICTKATEKLTRKDYDKLLPLLINVLKQYEKIRWYFEMEDFKGWELKALWEDVKFDIQHANDFEKIAMVGEKKWQQWMTGMMKLFTKAEVKFFEFTERNIALEWIKSK